MLVKVKHTAGVLKGQIVSFVDVKAIMEEEGNTILILYKWRNTMKCGVVDADECEIEII